MLRQTLPLRGSCRISVARFIEVIFPIKSILAGPKDDRCPSLFVLQVFWCLPIPHFFFEFLAAEAISIMLRCVACAKMVYRPAQIALRISCFFSRSSRQKAQEARSLR